LGYRDPEAEDILQETFITAIQQIHEFEFRSSLYSWLYRICLNRCYNRLRNRKRQVALVEEELEVLADPLSIEREDRKAEEAGYHRVLEHIESQMPLLGKPCRELLDMRDRQDKSYAEISQTLKIPLGTVMSRLARCKEALKGLVLQAMKGSTGA
jgi:RNA polymerase sigma-70 factor (ECF subfamily)